MFVSLRVRLLAAALTAVVLALIANGIASYVTVQNHNNEQISENLEAVVSGQSGWELVVALMDSIAFQSNLLALNASIEATRAAEQLQEQADHLTGVIGRFKLSGNKLAHRALPGSARQTPALDAPR